MAVRCLATVLRRSGIRPAMPLLSTRRGCRCGSWAITPWDSARGPRLALRDPARSQSLRTGSPGCAHPGLRSARGDRRERGWGPVQLRRGPPCRVRGNPRPARGQPRSRPRRGRDGRDGYQAPYGSLAQVRLCAALALLASCDTDHASEHLAPVSTLPPEMRLATFTGRLSQCAALASAAPYQGSVTARAIAADIAEYLGADPVALQHPLAIGPGSVR
jgi:hypothetical protein